MYFCRLSYRPVPGVRKSGMPAETEAPAPSITITFCARASRAAKPASEEQPSADGSADGGGDGGGGEPAHERHVASLRLTSNGAVAARQPSRATACASMLARACAGKNAVGTL